MANCWQTVSTELRAKGVRTRGASRGRENIRAVDSSTARVLLPVHPHHHGCRRHGVVFICVSFVEESDSSPDIEVRVRSILGSSSLDVEIIWLTSDGGEGAIRQRTKVNLVVSGRVCSVQKLSGAKKERV